MSDAPQLPGPDRKTLLSLRAMLPSYIDGLAKRRIGGKGKPALVRKPRKVCKVCCVAFDHAMLRASDDTAIEGDLCERCKAHLDNGGFAIVAGGDYALLKSPEFTDWAGQIHKVSPAVMEQVKTRFEVLKKNDTPPTS